MLPLLIKNTFVSGGKYFVGRRIIAHADFNVKQIVSMSGADYLYSLSIENHRIYRLHLIETVVSDFRKNFEIFTMAVCHLIFMSIDSILWCLDHNGFVHEYDAFEDTWINVYNLNIHGITHEIRDFLVTMETLEWVDKNGDYNILKRINGMFINLSNPLPHQDCCLT